MKSLTEFINEELYPAIYERLDAVFPDMEFKRKGTGWQSPHYLDGRKADRADKCYATTRIPTRVAEQGARSLSFVDFELVRSGHNEGDKGEPLVEAVRSLASRCGLELPEGANIEEYEKYRAKQEALESYAFKMRRELFSPEGAEVLSYLTEKRGYTVEEVKAMGLGYCSKETASAMTEELGVWNEEKKRKEYAPGAPYTLAIPYRSGASILGFKLRATADVKPKYLNSKGLPKKASLFGLTGLRLTGNGEKDRDVTIVEGELDALYARAKGLENVVSSTGVEGISSEAMAEARRRGVRRATLVIDVEKTEEEQMKKERAIRDALYTIQGAGITPLVVTLPAEAPGEKVDVDSFLHKHTAEDLEKVIAEASTAGIYLFLSIYDRYKAKQVAESPEEYKGDGFVQITTERLVDDFREETIALFLDDSEIVPPMERSRIIETFGKVTEDACITKEAIQEEVGKRTAEANKQKLTKKATEILQKGLSLLDTGEVGESIADLAESLLKLKETAKEGELSRLLELPQASSIRERLRTRPQGIETGYYFNTGGKGERLVLPAGAVTLFCAPPSHGKSTFLRNLALQTAGNGKEGVVLYFTFEEDMESTFMEFVNTYAGLELTTKSKDYNNLTSIAEYYRDNSTRYIRRESLEPFKQKEAEFMRDYIEAGKLRIFDGDYYSDELVEAIRYISHKLKVKAVFVDYIQLLYKRGNKLQRNEELKEIAKSLRQLAKAEKLPIVLAGQLNRDAKSPIEMHSQNIADSADLEREANKVILLWNTAFTQINNSNYKGEAVNGKELHIGTAGHIYGKLSKNRGGIPNIDALLTFNGNTGRIEANYEPKEEKEEPEYEGEELFGK